MPRYFFHSCDGTQDIDRLGHDFPDDDAARLEAIRYAGALLGDDPGVVGCNDGLRINVTKEDGRLSCAIIILAVDANWRQHANDIAIQTPPTSSRE